MSLHLEKTRLAESRLAGFEWKTEKMPCFSWRQVAAFTQPDPLRQLELYLEGQLPDDVLSRYVGRVEIVNALLAL